MRTEDQGEQIVPWSVRGGIVQADPLNRQATTLSTAPGTLDHLEKLLGGPKPYMMIPTGERAPAINKSGLPEEMEVVVVARTQPANAANEQTSFTLSSADGSGVVVHGMGVVVALANGAPAPRFQHQEHLPFRNIADPDVFAARISFEPREAEPKADDEPLPSHDTKMLADFLAYLLGALEHISEEGVIRLQALDDAGNEVGARVVHCWHTIEARRWALDNYDQGLTTVFDGLIRRPLPLGVHKQSPATGTLFSPPTESEEPDFMLAINPGAISGEPVKLKGVPAPGDIPLKIGNGESAPSKNAKKVLYPIPGLPLRNGDDVARVTWSTEA